MPRRFVKCKHCGKPILEGDTCIVDRCCIGVFCSVECWALEHGNFRVKALTDDVVKLDADMADFDGDYY